MHLGEGLITIQIRKQETKVGAIGWERVDQLVNWRRALNTKNETKGSEKYPSTPTKRRKEGQRVKGD